MFADIAVVAACPSAGLASAEVAFAVAKDCVLLQIAEVQQVADLKPAVVAALSPGSVVQNTIVG